MKLNWKSLIFIAILLSAIALFSPIMSMARKPAEIPLSEAVAMSQNGKIEKIDVEGDELLIIFPQTDTLTASHIAERIRSKVKNTIMKNRDRTTYNVTVSQGISSYIKDEDRTSLISRVDQALYKAKQNKRNRVEILS